MTSISIDVVAQRVRVLPGDLVITSTSDTPSSETPASDEARSEALTTAVVQVDAPDGRTVVRPAREGEERTWVALFTGDSAHGLDVPGMTVSLLAPLSAAGVSLFVASTATADLVLVARTDLPAAVEALRSAGHDLAT